MLRLLFFVTELGQQAHLRACCFNSQKERAHGMATVHGLQQPLVAQHHPAEGADGKRHDERDGKSPGIVLQAIGDVHAIQRGDERGRHHDDGDRGERTHHRVHVVVDDARVGVHRRLQDVGVDAGGLSGLRHLDIDILNEVGVELVHLQLELQFLQEVLVAADRGDEVGERVLQPGEADEALVVHLVVEVVLGLLDERVDLLQPFEVPHGRGEEEAEDHVDIVGEALAPLLLVGHEVDHHVGLVEADRDGDVALVYDAEGHGGVGRARSDLLHIGYAEDDEHPSVVILIAGSLIGIADVAEEVIGDVELLFQFALVLVGGTSDLYPAVGLPLWYGLQALLNVPICFHCS